MFCFFKRGKQNQAKETKQTKNKVKRKEVKDSPSEDVLSLPGNIARKSLMAPSTCRGMLRWKPQEQGMKQHSSKFPSIRIRGYRTSRRKEMSDRCCWQRG